MTDLQMFLLDNDVNNLTEEVVVSDRLKDFPLTISPAFKVLYMSAFGLVGQPALVSHSASLKLGFTQWLRIISSLNLLVSKSLFLGLLIQVSLMSLLFLTTV